MAPPTRLKWRDGILSGTAEALTSGHADLAIGATAGASNVAGLQSAPLGDLRFIFVVAPHHPLARAPEPISDATLRTHRLIAVADSALRGNVTIGILAGQDVFTVDNMRAKIQAQLRGLGGCQRTETLHQRQSEIQPGRHACPRHAIAIEHDAVDLLRLAELGDERAHLLGCSHLVVFLERTLEVLREGRGVGERHARRVVDHLRVDVLRAAEDGLGLAYVYAETARASLSAGRLETVLDDWRPPEAGFFLYYPSRRLPPAGLQKFIELVKESRT